MPRVGSFTGGGIGAARLQNENNNGPSNVHYGKLLVAPNAL